MPKDSEDETDEGLPIEVDRSNVVLLVLGDTECMLLVPPAVSRDDLIDSLQSALAEVLADSSNVIRYDDTDFLN